MRLLGHQIDGGASVTLFHYVLTASAENTECVSDGVDVVWSICTANEWITGLPILLLDITPYSYDEI